MDRTCLKYDSSMPNQHLSSGGESVLALDCRLDSTIFFMREIFFLIFARCCFKSSKDIATKLAATVDESSVGDANVCRRMCRQRKQQRRTAIMQQLKMKAAICRSER